MSDSAPASRPARPRGLEARRVVLAVALAVVVAGGLLTHYAAPASGVGAALGDVAGDALYAVALYLLIAPGANALIIGAATVAGTWAIELLQLTDIPHAAAALVPGAALVLGSGFDPRDLVVYAAAAAVVMLVDLTTRRPARTPRSRSAAR